MHGVPKRWCGLLGGLASVLSSRAAAEEILTTTTTTDGGWIQDGVMMDVGVTAGSNLDPSVNIPDGITVVGFDVVTPSQEEVCVEIYSKSGSLEGFESDETAWTFLSTYHHHNVIPTPSIGITACQQQRDLTSFALKKQLPIRVW